MFISLMLGRRGYPRAFNCEVQIATFDRSSARLFEACIYKLAPKRRRAQQSTLTQAHSDPYLQHTTTDSLKPGVGRSGAANQIFSDPE